jgi:hypothetical protein
LYDAYACGASGDANNDLSLAAVLNQLMMPCPTIHLLARPRSLPTPPDPSNYVPTIATEAWTVGLAGELDHGSDSNAGDGYCNFRRWLPSRRDCDVVDSEI